MAKSNNWVSATITWVKTIRRNKIIAALLLLLQGILFIARPQAGMAGLARTVAIFLVLGAVADVAGYFLSKDKKPISTGVMILGVVIILVGLYFIIRPSVFAGILRYVVAVVAILTGISNILQTLRLEKRFDWRMILGLAINVLSVGLGLSLFLQPVAASAVLMQIIGGVLIINALSDLWLIVRMSQIVKTVKG